MISLEVHHNKVYVTDFQNPKDFDGLKKTLRIWIRNFNPLPFEGEFTLKNLWENKEKSFPTGYLSEIKRWAEKNKIKLEINDKRVYRRGYQGFKIQGDLPEMYDTQKEAFEKIKLSTTGIVAKATGSGKTRLILEATTYFNSQTLIIVPTKDIQSNIAAFLSEALGTKMVSTKAPKISDDDFLLYDQRGEEREEEEREIKNPLAKLENLYSGDNERPKSKNNNNLAKLSKLYTSLNLNDDESEEGSESPEAKMFKSKKSISEQIDNKKAKQIKAKIRKLKKEIRPITVLCFQSLTNTSKYFLNQVETVIIDECHHSAANSIREALLNMPNAAYRFGFSATPWRDMKAELLLFISSVGENIIYELKGKAAVDKGIIAKPNLITIEPPAPKNPDGVTFIRNIKYYREILERGIIYNMTRNDCIVMEAIEHYENNRNVFIAVDEIAHQDILKEKIQKALKNNPKNLPIVVNGQMNVLDKEKNVNIIGSTNGGLISIGTMAVGEGSDMPQISVVIMGAGGKSSTRFLQRIGRGTRKTQDQMIIVDFKDWFHPTLLKHFKARVKHYKKEFELDDKLTLRGHDG